MQNADRTLATLAQKATAADATLAAGIIQTAHALRDALTANVLLGENFVVVEKDGGWCIRVEDGNRARRWPSVLQATRWSEANAHRAAAELAAWGAVVRPYRAVVREQYENALDVLEWLATASAK